MYNFNLIAQLTCPVKQHRHRSHLAGFEEVKANVGVTCGRIQAVLTEVLTDILWCGLGQKAVYTLPEAKKRKAK